MTSSSLDPMDPGEIRRRAEELLGAEDAVDPGGVAPQRVLHELRVHQLELEMQNEALQEARLVAEAGWERFQELYDFAPAAYFSVDAQGTILEMNLVGARLLGAERAALLHRRFPNFLSTSDQALFAGFMRRGLENLENPPCEVSLPGSQPRGIRVRLLGASSADGKVLQLVAMDITELCLAQERAGHANEELQRQVERLTAQLEALRTELRMTPEKPPEA